MNEWTYEHMDELINTSMDGRIFKAVTALSIILKGTRVIRTQADAEP